MSAPTKEAIIGTFINGRNAQDDFLQLASNRGGTVFGWIDAAGHLQGSLLQGTGTPGGNNTDIQFNDGGTLGGSDAFSFNKTTSQFTLIQSGSLTPVGLMSIQGAGLGTSYQGLPILEELLVNHDSVAVLGWANASAPGNTAATRQDYFSVFAADVGGSSLNWYHGGVNYFTIDATGTNEVDIGAGSGGTGTNLAIGVFGLDGISVTETQYKHDGPINFVIQDGGTGNVDIAFNKTSTVWKNWVAATALVNQNSPALVLTGQAWLGVSPSSVTRTYTIQENNGNLQFTNAGSAQPVFPYQFDAPVQIQGNLFATTGAQFAFSTGNSGSVYTISAAANAVGSLTTYTATVTPGSQPLAGQTIVITGFVAHTSNNGTFVVQSSTLTTIVVYNSSGVAETQAATGTINNPYVSFSGFSSSFGLTTANFPIEGTSYPANAAFAVVPNNPAFVMTAKGDAVDAAYARILSDGSTGNHGLEIGAIIDGTGAAPVTLQIGHFNGNSSVRLGQPIAATGGANQSSNFLAIEGKYWTGSASAADVWSFQDALGAGANPGSTLNVTHTGSSGAPLFNLGSIALTCGQIHSTAVFYGGPAEFTVAAATGGGNVSSYQQIFDASWWDGAAAHTSATTIQEIMGSGTNPTTDTLTISNSGSHAWSGVSILGALTVSGTINGLTTPTASGSAVVTQTIASGTATLGTTLIASGAAAATVTVSATGVLTTDTLMADFNADPTAVTGYAPSASGMLTIIKFPTAGGVNFIVVNNTGSSITPGAITLNWRVVR